MQRMWVVLSLTVLVLHLESVSLAKSWLSPNGIVHATGSVVCKVAEVPMSAGRFLVGGGKKIARGVGADRIPNHVRTADEKLGTMARTATTPVRKYVIQPLSNGVVQPTRQKVARVWPFTWLSKTIAGSK